MTAKKGVAPFASSLSGLGPSRSSFGAVLFVGISILIFFFLHLGGRWTSLFECKTSDYEFIYRFLLLPLQ
jgi:hypothetical protein